jgi:hypothetical protein
MAGRRGYGSLAAQGKPRLRAALARRRAGASAGGEEPEAAPPGPTCGGGVRIAGFCRSFQTPHKTAWRRFRSGSSMPINRRSRLYGRFHCGLPTQCARAALTEGHGAPQFWQRAGFRGRPGPAPCVLRSAAMRRASRFVSLCIHTEDSRFALVRVHACGVCRTDLHVVEGELAPRKSPVVPGTRWRAWWKRTDSTRRGSILASAGGGGEQDQRRRSPVHVRGIWRTRRGHLAARGRGRNRVFGS